MANVGFKRGPQDNLQSLITNNQVVDGVFYLTSDTNRLYIGKGTNVLAPVNEGVVTVDTTNDLPAASTSIAGSFYYVKQGNILCVHNGTKWVQINSVVKNSDLTTTVSDHLIGNEDISTSVINTITDSEGTALSSKFNLKAQKGTIGLAVTHNTVKVGEKDVVVSDITLSGDVYALQSPVVSESGASAEVELLSEFGHSSKMQFGSNDGSIKFAKNGEQISVEGFSAAENTLSASPRANGTGFEVVFTDHNGVQSDAIIDPQVVVGKTPIAGIGFTNGTAKLPVYTSGEIDDLISGIQDDFSGQLKAFNAMEYKGTVGSNTGATVTALPTQNVAVGHAYLASSNITIDGVNYAQGTLFVAVAKEGVEEDTNGFLPSDGIEWTNISGTATDTRYSLKKSADIFGLELRDSTNSSAGYFKLVNTDTEDKSGLKFEHDSTSADGDIIVNIGHKEVTIGASPVDGVTQEAQSNLEITYVNGITQDKYGHITGFTTQKATIKDTKVNLNKLAIGVAQNGTNKVNITPSAELKDANGAITTAETTEAFSISSSSLEVNANGTDISMNLVWGSF